MNIAIVGFGTEGRASYDYWNDGTNQLTIVDERNQIDGAPEGVACITGPDALTRLEAFDLIVRTPGVNPNKLPYGDKVWSATNEFFEKCPTKHIIGVTGTKGKGTTCSLITSILRAAGKTVHLIGNIGSPALGALPHVHEDDIVVYEMSSFQLWDIKYSPHIAVVLMVEPDHLDVHSDMPEYIDAKANIVRFQDQNDLVVYNQHNDISTSIAERSSARHAGYPNPLGTLAESMRIPGAHNEENASAAIEAVTDYIQDTDVIAKGLSDFTGLPHRIKFVREVHGVQYYDDSYSSAPAATIAAMKSFDRPEIVIIGGYEKHADFDALATYVAGAPNVKQIVLIGQTCTRIADVFARHNVDINRYMVSDATTLAEVMNEVVSHSKAGDVILLSPGCASFDMFANFTDRGNQFVGLVREL